jgi:hypothetical protein
LFKHVLCNPTRNSLPSGWALIKRHVVSPILLSSLAKPEGEGERD